MNLHRNTTTRFHSPPWSVRLPDNLTAVSFDHMPVEVATEMLCSPKAKMTNRERKECARAREHRYESTRLPKPDETRLAQRLGARPFLSLVKWNSRAIERRALAIELFKQLANHIDKLVRLEKQTPMTELSAAMAKRKQAQLDLAVERHDVVIKLTDEEIRLRLCKKQ